MEDSKGSIPSSPIHIQHRHKSAINNGNGKFHPQTALQKISITIIGTFEKYFFNLGYVIALHPWRFITASLIFAIACSVGLIGYNQENRPDKLWIPWNSDFVLTSDWMRKNFPSPIRFHYSIVTADDVLDPKIMKMLYRLHKTVNDIKVQGGGWSWNDICYKLPVTKFSYERRRRKRRETKEHKPIDDPFIDFANVFDDDFFKEDINPIQNITSTSATTDTGEDSDELFHVPNSIYCPIINNLEEACWESNLIELWNYDEKIINSLTKQDILNKINSPTISPVFGRKVDYLSEIGEVTRNETNHIVSAKAITLRWYNKINQTAMRLEDTVSDIGTGETVDKVNLLWEKELAAKLLNFTTPEGVEFYFSLARSFGDISQKSIWGDASLMAVGFGIVFIYVVIMLGKFNKVEQRLYLAISGLSCVILAILVSYGICSAFRIIYGPVHNILPFLLLGIGIDDMFVIMQSWNNLRPEEQNGPLPERVGLALKHAGVSITVTSLTDFVAFAIGGTTVLPALQSFCIYAAIGILATYFFQVTFFVAWFSLDQKRIEDNRNALFPCIKHKKHKPNECSQRNFAKDFFTKYYCKILFTKPAKILVVLITLTLFGVNIWGNILLRQEFSPIWFLPHDSYLFKYVMARDKFFPNRGYEAIVVMNNVTFPENLQKMDTFMNKLENSSSVYQVDAWFPAFKSYAKRNYKTDIIMDELTEEKFQEYMGKFLFSPVGSRFRPRFKVDGNLTCGKSIPEVQMSSLAFKFTNFKGPEEHIPAMLEIKDLIKNTNFTPKGQSKTFVWSLSFVTWETDQIITAELYRNIGLAMACVMICMLVLIANLSTCMMVLTCVCFTLVDVGGIMHWWGLTIDTVSCIDLVLAIGLCVDYAAHIGHTFMTCVGTREERAKQALINIGPAVLNGGFSTFLAFILLIDSESHVFITFFKIFFLVVLFGLFHGLVFLPVILSLLGPEPYASAIERWSNFKPEVFIELKPSTSLIKINSYGGDHVKAENGLLLTNNNIDREEEET